MRPEESWFGIIRAALDSGVVAVQFRDKDSSSTKRLSLGLKLLELCHDYDVPLIINDDVELVSALDADGVHLGGDDCDLVRARDLLGPEAIIGISCYDTLSLAVRAARGGADYVAFGRFFPSGTNPAARHADLAVLQQARRTLNMPRVAIGGIASHNARPLIDAGADVLAVIGAVFDSPDPSAEVSALNALFQGKET